MISVDEMIVIYGDGACSGNPGKGGWGTIVAARSKIVELGGSELGTTNNRMEMTAIMRGLEAIQDLDGDVIVVSDSTYVLKGITQWVFGWKKRNWQTAEGKPVSNQDLWEEFDSIVRRRKTKGKIDFRYVKGHSGNEGNERCDTIAVAFSKGMYEKLFSGKFTEYSFSVLPPPEKMPFPENKKSTDEKPKTLYYLAYVNGVLSRYDTWADCERAVKGRPGAKFKKITNENEESAVLKNWGL